MPPLTRSLGHSSSLKAIAFFNNLYKSLQLSYNWRKQILLVIILEKWEYLYCAGRLFRFGAAEQFYILYFEDFSAFIGPNAATPF